MFGVGLLTYCKKDIIEEIKVEKIIGDKDIAILYTKNKSFTFKNNSDLEKINSKNYKLLCFYSSNHYNMHVVEKYFIVNGDTLEK